MTSALALAAALLAACAGEVTAPTASQVVRPAFTPAGANAALIGIDDGTYVFTVDPTTDQTIHLGESRLELPANSICDLERSSYGERYWDSQCSPERAPVIISAIIKNANSDHPSVEFQPAMRFNPRKTVNLYIYSPKATKKTQFPSLLYCNSSNRCVDESRSDDDLKTHVDSDDDMVFRRIKHFSGYLVSTFAESAEPGSWGW
jgi:hypothetical protein